MRHRHVIAVYYAVDVLFFQGTCVMFVKAVTFWCLSIVQRCMTSQMPVSISTAAIGVVSFRSYMYIRA